MMRSYLVTDSVPALQAYAHTPVVQNELIPERHRPLFPATNTPARLTSRHSLAIRALPAARS